MTVSTDFAGHGFDTVVVPGIGSLLWPTGDVHLRKWTHLVSQVDEVLSFTPGRKVCVQAGGACGIWPLALSKSFDLVYTFEPFVPNFKALSYNCVYAENIIALNAALSDSCGTVGIGWEPGHEENFGAQFIRPNGSIPKLSLDSLQLRNLDLLYLDLEGAEFLAMRGAESLIREFAPVIVYEDRDHCKRFGFTRAQIAEWLADLGYRKVSSLSRNDDAVMVCDRS